MVVWSGLSRSLANLSQARAILNTVNLSKACKNGIQLRQMSGGHRDTFYVTPTRFQWNKFKDMLHFYVMLGVIPITAIVFYANVFIGPAQLTETPADYTPKHWEYYKHPITRFLTRYVYPSPQQEYEKMCHLLHEESEKAAIRKLETKIRDLMRERQDYQAYYYRPTIAKYHRISKEAADYLESIRGD